jgi:Fe2+ transport system protein FeoA
MIPLAQSAHTLRYRSMSHITLSHAGPGTFRCIEITGEGERVVRLKRMGICSGRHITIVQSGDPMILRVVGARIGLSRELAATVIVDSDRLNAGCVSNAASASCNGDQRD